MLKDITLGQYFPGETVIHRLDPRIKIGLTTLFIIVLFIANNLFSYIIMGAALVMLIGVSKIPLKVILKGLKPIFVIVIITAILNVIYTSGDILWQWHFLKVTREGIYQGVFMALRIVYLIIGTSMLLTYTTSPIMLTDAVELIFNPLKQFGFPAHELAMMMTIALRFIPTLIEETEKIINAQKARGADFESGNILRRARALIPILVPLFVSAFKRADELAIAMESRCYQGGKNRTRLKTLKTSEIDYIALAIMTVFSAGIIVFNFF
jgi:energy-coupling factor transport system permease protein